MMIRINPAFAVIGLSLLLASPARAVPPTDVERGGEMKAEIDGNTVTFPILKSDIRADIQGDLATVTVTQVFANPTSVPLNATYLFPLNNDAAVYAMTMRVADELIRAKIQKKEEARKTFEAAKEAGKSAALLNQKRPNMFTQEVANLMPNQPVTVTLKYTTAVPRIDGAYELVLPLVVGPRYVPKPKVNLVSSRDAEDVPSKRTAQEGWSFRKLPKYPDVFGLTVPETIDADRVRIAVNITSAVAISGVASPTHALDVAGDETARRATLSSGKTIDNRDFVLRYELAGRSAQAGILTHRDERGGFFSLLIEPPKEIPPAMKIVPREMVFVLDTSGSMSGKPIEASKTFMRETVKHLRPGDYFRIIRFSNNASEFTSGPVAATPENIASGLRYVKSLTAGGGTEIPNAIRQAFAVRQQPDTLRIVVFLTDGYIGNEAEVLRLISGTIGEARIYAFGVGTGVNRYLLNEMGRMGRGYARFIDPTEDAEAGAIDLAAKLKTPVLTDIEIDWKGLKARALSPAAVPDLFAGDSIRVQGRFEGEGTHKIEVSGKVNGQAATLPVRIVLPAEDARHSNSEAIPLIWARSQIADYMRGMIKPANLRPSGWSRERLEQAVTDLGLEYSLMTQFTSFVAVSEQVVNEQPGLAKDSSVPLPMVKGVTGEAYGIETKPVPSRFLPNGQQRAALPAGRNVKMVTNFAGGSTPEPHEWLAILVVMIMTGFGYVFARRTS